MLLGRNEAPASLRTLTSSLPSGRFSPRCVKIWITPFAASEPYSDEPAAPLTISTLSMSSAFKSASVARVIVPSTMTSGSWVPVRLLAARVGADGEVQLLEGDDRTGQPFALCPRDLTADQGFLRRRRARQYAEQRAQRGSRVEVMNCREGPQQGAHAHPPHGDRRGYTAPRADSLQGPFQRPARFFAFLPPRRAKLDRAPSDAGGNSTCSGRMSNLESRTLLGGHAGT